MTDLSPHIFLMLGLSLLTALGYAVATFGMKLASSGLGWVGVAIILAGFAAAAIAEIILLQRVDLARTYVIILGVESILIFSLALWIGESLSPVRIAGAVLVLAGLTLTLA